MAKQAQTQPKAFIDILDRPASEVERPKPLPVGTYFCVVKGLPRHDVSSKKQTPFVEFTLAVQSAGEDVDEDDLKEWMSKPDGSSRAMTDATIRATYYKTEEALYRLIDFLEHCGIDLEGKSINAAIDETPNSQVMAYIRHVPSSDGQSIFAELAKTAPVEE